MKDDEEYLLERIRQGDGESFGVLYDRTRGWLLDFVIRPRLGSADAEDVLSETYQTALDKIRSFEWRGVSLLHWLASIAKRKSLEHSRKRTLETRREEPLPDLFDLPDPEGTVEAELVRKDQLAGLRERVHETLGRLPPRYAEALRLRLVDGCERSECASRLEVSVATFDVVLYRATRAFAREWKLP